jgi:hypothetical protein
LLLSSVILLGASPRLQAQSVVSEKECEKAAKIIARGHPEKKERDAFALLSACGSVGANALATGLGQYRSETDTVALELFMRPVDGWRDATIMDAAARLASDPAAAVPARVFAIRHLTRLVNPLFLFQYGNLAVGDSAVRDASGNLLSLSLGCAHVGGSWFPSRVGTPLPTDYRARIQALLVGLAKDSAAPTSVRNAAQCADFNLDQ